MPLDTFRGIPLPRLVISGQLGQGSSIDRYVPGISGTPTDVYPGQRLNAQTNEITLNGLYADRVLDIKNQIRYWDDFPGRVIFNNEDPNTDAFLELNDYRNPYSGNSVFAIKLSGTQTGRFSFNRNLRLPANPNEDWRFGLWVKGTHINLTVQFVVGKDGSPDERIEKVIEQDLTENWERVFTDVNTGDNANEVYFNLIFNAPSDLVIDAPEFGLFGRDPFINECTDHSFEQGITEGYWSTTRGGVSIYNSLARFISDGIQSVYFTDRTGNNPYNLQTPSGVEAIELEYFRRYYIAFDYARGPVANRQNAGLQLRAKFFDSLGRTDGTKRPDQVVLQLANNKSVPNFVEFGNLITPPQGAKYMQLIFEPQSAHENETYDFVIDNVSVNPFEEDKIISAIRQKDMINELHGLSGRLTRIEGDHTFWQNAHLKVNNYEVSNERIYSKTEAVSLTFQMESKFWKDISPRIVSGDFTDLHHSSKNDGVENLDAILTLNLSGTSTDADLTFSVGECSWRIAGIDVSANPTITIDGKHETIKSTAGGTTTDIYSRFSFLPDHGARKMLVIPEGSFDLDFTINGIDTSSTFELEFYQERS